MPKYPMVEPYAAQLENTVESTELDCGCVIWRDEFEEAALLYFCTLHNVAQQLLDALDQVAVRAYRSGGTRCRFCALTLTGPESQLQHRPPCPMNVIHQVIRRAKGGESHETNPGMPPEDPSNSA